MKLTEIQFDLQSLKSLNLENIGSWPPAVRGVVIASSALLVMAIGWYYDTQDQRDFLDQAVQQEQTLKTQLESKQRQAVNLEPLRQQLEDIKQSFGDMLKRLPNKTEIAGLLVDISQQGLGAGLEFELFKPGAEQPADFYVQLPIQIRVTGKYHEFGRFVSGVADLPRIVTQHDLHIKSTGKDGFVMEATAKTYRYMDEQEEAAEAAKQQAAKKK
jgi:type IV pilus assembly protein PilO